MGASHDSAPWDITGGTGDYSAMASYARAWKADQDELRATVAALEARLEDQSTKLSAYAAVLAYAYRAEGLPVPTWLEPRPHLQLVHEEPPK